MSASRKSLWLDWLLVLAIFLASNLNSALRQKQNTLNGGTAVGDAVLQGRATIHSSPAAAGRSTLRLSARHALGGVAHQLPDSLRAFRATHIAGLAAATTTEGPYTYAISGPWLMSFVSPPDLFRGFRIVNITGSAIAVILLVFWLRGYVSDWRVRALLVALFVMQWDAPPRLFTTRRPRRRVAVCLRAAGVARPAKIRGATFRRRPRDPQCPGHRRRLFPRSHALRFPFLDRCPWPAREGERPLAMAAAPVVRVRPLFCGFLAFLSTRLFAHQTDAYSFWETIYRFLYEKPVLTYVHAWFFAFGPVLFILLYDWKGVRDFLLQEQWLVLFLAAGAGFGFVGGTDTERLQYWSMPGGESPVGPRIERHRSVLASGPLIAVFAIGQILSARILWTTPDYPRISPTPSRSSSNSAAMCNCSTSSPTTASGPRDDLTHPVPDLWRRRPLLDAPPRRRLEPAGNGVADGLE